MDDDTESFVSKKEFDINDLDDFTDDVHNDEVTDDGRLAHRSSQAGNLLP